MQPRFVVLFAFVAALLRGQDAERPTWRAVARMESARTGHCAAGAGERKVLIVGGRDENGPLRSTEVYGPDDKFAAAAPLQEARSGLSCTTLEDGRVAVAGGGAGGSAVEVWAAAQDAWTPSTGDSFPNSQHTATRLADGRVLLAGGEADGAFQGTLALYDPAANQVRRLAATLMEPRRSHVAALLSDGRVLLAGGEGISGALRSAEIFDPRTETIWPAGALALPRARAGAAVLPGGRVLIAGGTSFAEDHGNAELYLEGDNRWEWVSQPMAAGRRSPFVALLPSGQVLVAGGDLDGVPVGTTEVFDPATLEFRLIGELTAPRTSIAGALLPETATVLATGGTGLTGPSPLCGTIVVSETLLTTRNGARGATEFEAGETVTAAGSGFRDGVPVTLSLATREGVSQTGRLLTTTATPAATGFSVAVFRPDAGDIGRSFVLTASQTGGPALTTAFNARNRVIVAGGPTATSSFAGTAITFAFTLNPTANAGPMNGSVTLTVGPLSRTIALLTATPGAQISQSVCCVAQPGAYQASIRYLGDSKYQPGSSVVVNHTVNAATLQLSAGVTSLPLFEDVDIPLTVALPVGTPAGQPAPTGSLSLSGSGAGPLTLTLSPSPRGNSSATSFRFRATFATRPSGCFNARYSGDARYPAQDMSVCIAVGLARTTLQVTPSPADYSFGTLLPLSVRLTFPAEVGVVTRQINLVQATRNSADGTVNTFGVGESGAVPLITIGQGVASVDLTTAIQFDRTTLTVNYAGGGDLQTTSVQVPLRMRQLATQAVLRPIPSPSFQPLALSVLLVGCPIGTDCSRIAPPTGSVRFFDGDLVLGDASITGLPGGMGQAIFFPVTRPPGVRQFRASYAGDTIYSPATSATASVTVQ